MTLKRTALMVCLMLLPLSADAGAIKSGWSGLTLDGPAKGRLEKSWKKVSASGGDMVWSYRISPPFPSTWPARGGGVDYYYVYADGHDIRNMIADGAFVAAPWARIDVSGSVQKFVQLSKKLEQLGIQGVRPLERKEIQTIERAQRRKRTDYAGRRDYYCLWLATHGMIAESIRPDNRAFFTWLACDKK